MNFLTFLTKKIELLEKYSDDSKKSSTSSSDIDSIFKNGLSKENLEKEIDYEELAKKLADSSGSSVETGLAEDIDVGNIFEEFLNIAGKDEIDGILDSGYQDGIISADELETYMEKLMGDDEVLTMSDFEDAITNAKIDMDEIYKTQKSEIEAYYKDTETSSTSSSSGTGGTSGSGSTSSEDGTTSEKDPKDMSLSELKSEQTQATSNITSSQTKYQEAVEKRKNNQTKQQEYIDQLNATKDETAMQLAQQVQNISDIETQIFDTQDKINVSSTNILNLQNNISTLNGEIGTLESQVAQLESSSSAPTKEGEQTVDYSAQIAALEAQIEAKKATIQEDEAKIDEENANITTYNAQLDDLGTQLTQAEEEKTNLENSLSTDIATKLSEAKTNYETEQKTNSSLISDAQDNYLAAVTRLNEINKYIAIKEKPTNLSEEGSEYLDEINNPDEDTELNETHYEELMTEIQGSDIPTSEKIFLMSQMKSVICTDSSLSGLEAKFKEFVQDTEIQAEIEKDKSGRLAYQADFIKNN